MFFFCFFLNQLSFSSPESLPPPFCGRRLGEQNVLWATARSVVFEKKKKKKHGLKQNLSSDT